MNIEEALRADLSSAMKSKEREKLDAIRSVQAEVSTAKSAPGFKGEVDDDLYRRKIATYVKRISKSKAEYDALGESGVGQSEKLAYEIDYLGKYLPKVLDEDATRELVGRVISDLGAESGTPAGRVIGAVMKSGEDLDGALVNRLVSEALES